MAQDPSFFPINVLGFKLGQLKIQAKNWRLKSNGYLREVQALKTALEEQRVAADVEMEMMKNEAAERVEALRAEYTTREERIQNKLEAIKARMKKNDNNHLGQILAAAGVQFVQSIDMTTFINALKQAIKV